MPHLSIQNETIALMISGCEEFLVITFFCPPVGGQLENFAFTLSRCLLLLLEIA